MTASGLLAFAWYAALLLARDGGLATFAYDQAFFQQLVWNLDHGHGFVSSFSPGSFLGLHFEPLLLLPAAVELAWPDPRALSLLAALAIAGLAPAAFLCLRSMTGSPAAAAALAAPLPFWPALQEAARAGFHPELLGVDFALLAGWAALSRRAILVWVFALLALSAKEDQAWNLLVVGLAVAAVPGRRRPGLQLAGAALVSGLVVAGVLMPVLRAGRQLDTDSYYGWLAHASPAAVAQALAAPGGWLAFLTMVLCAAGLPVLRPAWLALAVPPLLADLLSAHDPQPLLHLQYALPLVVPVLVAAARAAPAVTASRPAWLVALPPAFAALTLGGLPPAFAADPASFERAPALARLEACVRVLPPAAPVAADDPLLPALASRPSLRELGAARPADYLVIDRIALLPGYVVKADRQRVLAGGGRAVLCDDGRFLVKTPAAP